MPKLVLSVPDAIQEKLAGLLPDGFYLRPYDLALAALAAGVEVLVGNPASLSTYQKVADGYRWASIRGGRKATSPKPVTKGDEHQQALARTQEKVPTSEPADPLTEPAEAAEEVVRQLSAGDEEAINAFLGGVPPGASPQKSAPADDDDDDFDPDSIGEI